jgi:tight adherence protein B
MIVIRLLSFALIVFGMFYLFRINPISFIQGLSTPFYKKDKLKIRVLLSQGRKKKSFLYQLIEDTRNILMLNGKEDEFPKVFLLSVTLALVGLLFGFSLSNYFIVPVLGMGLCTLPFIYIKYLGIRLTKQLNEELETAMSIITSSYIRCEDIVTAIEENKDYINPPVKEVFDQFVMEANLLNPNIKMLLRNLKSKIPNTVFKEWCDALIACQEDGSLKTILTPIVKKCSNIRLVTVRLDAMLYAPVKEYITMVLLLVLNVPMMYFLNKTWFEILLYHTAGKIVLAICAAVIFVSALAVIKISKPIEYKR